MSDGYFPKMPAMPAMPKVKMPGFMSLSSGNLSEEQLRVEFDKIDLNNNGRLDKAEITRALENLGKTDDEIKSLVDSISGEDLDFDGFKNLLKQPGFMSLMPAMPKLPGFMSFIWGNLTDEQLRVEFDKIDVDKSGKLEKPEIASALQELGKTEDEAKLLVDSISEEALDFDGFRNLVKSQSSIPSMPTMPAMPSFASLSWGGLTDQQLLREFDKLDVDKSGKLEKDEIARALKGLGKTEDEIKLMVDSISEDALDFDGFRNLVKPKSLVDSISESVPEIPAMPMIPSLSVALH